MVARKPFWFTPCLTSSGLHKQNHSFSILRLKSRMALNTKPKTEPKAPKSSNGKISFGFAWAMLEQIRKQRILPEMGMPPEGAFLDLGPEV